MKQPTMIAVEKMKMQGAWVTNHQTRIRQEVTGADEVHVVVFEGVEPIRFPLQETSKGVWELCLDKGLHGVEYLYEIRRGVEWVESIDPFAHSVNENSERGVFVDLSSSNPEGWGEHRPSFNKEETIIYELHVRDFTKHENSGVKEKGFFVGLGEKDTYFKEGISTGLNHLKELGISHVHLLPVNDFTSVDDANVEHTYNWGYDPFLYNAPEGSYSTVPQMGALRVVELKQMIQEIHKAGLCVILDVVYNHTSHERHSPFEAFHPNTFYRKFDNGEYGNGSGCGNELNTEHPIVRSFILESLSFWMTEYHIDGFRFDLMALIDRETVLLLESHLLQLNPNCLLYGEPWVGGLTALPLEKQFLKGSQWNSTVALFNDEYRNALKGDNDGFEKGIISGNAYHQLGALRGMVGSIEYNEWLKGFAKDPVQSINYLSSHDNLCLGDKINLSAADFSYEDRIRMNRLAFGVLLLSQGIPFIAQGTEFIRSKQGQHNSYNTGDAINAIDWSKKEEHLDTFEYVKQLIRLRRDQTYLSMASANDVRQKMKLTYNENRLIGFQFKGESEADYEELLFIHNFNPHAIFVDLPKGEWLMIGYDNHIDFEGKEWVSSQMMLPYLSTSIFVRL